MVRKLLADAPDANQLARYARDRAADAFDQLVALYGRLVWGQCRALLGADADAEDAFRATFLVLARKSDAVRDGAPLGPWLHGVAYRVCQNALRARRRRATRERAAARPEAARPVVDAQWDATLAAVVEEVQKLPARQREAFVLCHVEGGRGDRPARRAEGGRRVGPPPEEVRPAAGRGAGRPRILPARRDGPRRVRRRASKPRCGTGVVSGRPGLATLAPRPGPTSLTRPGAACDPGGVRQTEAEVVNAALPAARATAAPPPAFPRHRAGGWEGGRRNPVTPPGRP